MKKLQREAKELEKFNPREEIQRITGASMEGINGIGLAKGDEKKGRELLAEAVKKDERKGEIKKY